jgi:type I restriction enzyme S subunit
MVADQYKQTEVGVIPSDWEVKTIGEIFTFYSTSNFSKAEMTLYGEVGCVHYGLIHAIENSHYSLSSGIKYYVTKEQAKYETIQEGDVIMVDASEDLVGLNKSVEVFNLNYKQYIAGLHTFHLRDTNSNFVGTFRGLILNSNSVKKQMLRLAVGMKVFGVSKPQLQQVFVPVPPISEQTAIATALSDTDALIGGVEKLIAKKRNIKQGAMQQLLSSTGSDGKPKEGWVVKKLGEIGEFKNGINKGAEDFGFGSPFVNLMDVFGVSKIKTNLHLGLINANETDKKMYDLRKGDVLFIRSSVKPEGVGLTCLIECDLDNTVFSGFIIRYRDYGNLSDEFKEYCFSSSHFRNKVIASSSVSANTNINQDALKNLFLSYPNSKPEQTRIATILSDMDAEIAALETKLEKYRQVKLGMMQELLTGKIRLNQDLQDLGIN